MQLFRPGATTMIALTAALLVGGQAAAYSLLRSEQPAPSEPPMVLAQVSAAKTSSTAAIPNAASLSLQMSPADSVDIGSKVVFRATAKKSGYLLLLDIDATGKMSQIFPSPEMIVQSEEAAMNLVKAGEELVIPNTAARKNGFEYVITPPTGQAAVVAILSERRVQILDLPDEAQKPRPNAEVITDLAKWTETLRIPDSATGKLVTNNWSFDLRAYSIK